MRGVVLAAGGGNRLRPLTDELPKTLLPVDGERTILELVVANLAEVAVDDITVVTGHCADRIAAAVPHLEATYGTTLDLEYNSRFAEANNAYSLWLTRHRWDDEVLLVNGDTVHPVDVERRLLEARGTSPLLLAIDDRKPLADEEMKVRLSPDGTLTAISKQLDPATVAGEYIGVSLIAPAAARALATALETTFERDPDLYYEDGYQAYVDAGGGCLAVPIGDVRWVEVDDHADLEVARGLTCRS